MVCRLVTPVGLDRNLSVAHYANPDVGVASAVDWAGSGNTHVLPAQPQATGRQERSKSSSQVDGRDRVRHCDRWAEIRASTRAGAEGIGNCGCGVVAKGFGVSCGGEMPDHTERTVDLFIQSSGKSRAYDMVPLAWICEWRGRED